VLSYYVLTFAISWGGVLALVGLGGLPARLDQRMGIGLIMLAGPSLAGLLMAAVLSGRAGLSDMRVRLLTWRVSWRWYAVALLTAPLLTLAAGVALSLRSPEFLPVIAVTGDPVAALVLALAAGLLIAICEELGWTGFAIPQLRRRHGIIATGLTLGLMWGAWHFVLFWEAETFSGPVTLALLLVRLFGWLPAYRILMVWVYDRTASLLVVVLMHASLAATQLLVQPPASTTEASLISVLGWAAALWLVVAAVAIANGWRVAQRPRRQRAA
jgi:membrane protease YdiL (CAAX protease family)